MQDGEDSTIRCGYTHHPTKDEHPRLKRHTPEGCSKYHQNDQTIPFKPAARSEVDMRKPVAVCTNPTLVEAERQQRNSENMQSIESANLRGTPRLRAGKAVVVATRHPLRAEMIQAMNDKQGFPSRPAIIVHDFSHSMMANMDARETLVGIYQGNRCHLCHVNSAGILTLTGLPSLSVAGLNFHLFTMATAAFVNPSPGS